MADPSIADHRTVQLELLALHGRVQDFDEGDLLHRLDRFNAFVLKSVDIAGIDLAEFDVDQDKVDQFKVLYQATGTCPRIVFDEIDGSVIDGVHRANALAQLGITRIDAYVGEAAHADCNWTRDAQDEDSLEDEESEDGLDNDDDIDIDIDIDGIGARPSTKARP